MTLPRQQHLTAARASATFPDMKLRASVLGVLCLAAACSKSTELRVSAVEPLQGTTLGNETVVLRGSGFVPGKTSCTVKFGKMDATNVTIQSESAIAVTTPGQERGAVDILVQFDDGKAFTIPKGFTFVEPSTDRARELFLSNPTGNKGAKGGVAPATPAAGTAGGGGAPSAPAGAAGAAAPTGAAGSTAPAGSVPAKK